MIVLNDLPEVEHELAGAKNLDLKLFRRVDEMLDALETLGDEACVIVDKPSDRNIVPLIHLIKKMRSGRQLYVLSRRKDDTAFLKEMLKAKVDDLLFYEREGEIVPLIEQIGSGHGSRYARNVAFVGSGTGATFCLLNTAAAMKRLYPDLKISIVDCDYYKDDVVLRMDPGNRKPLTLNDLLIDSYEEQRGSFESILSYNRIADMLLIPSGGQSYYFSTALGREEEYLKLLSAISMQKDVTFFNIGSALTELSVSALRLSDRIYTCVTQEPVPLQVLLNLSGVFKELSQQKEMDLILNRYRRENRTITQEMIESVFSHRVSMRIPDQPAEALASELERRPVGGRGVLAEAFSALARKVVMDVVLSKESS